MCCLCGSIIEEEKGNLLTRKPNHCVECTVLIIENENNVNGDIEEFLDNFKRKHHRELQFV